MRFSDLLRLLRVEQWYKNSVIFIAIIFSFNLFHPELILLSFFGFLSLCLISSSNYIINDVKDINKDKHHPEKKNRPLASGRINPITAILISIILFNLSLLIAYSLSPMFLCSVLLLFIVSQLYTFFIRNIAFLDLIFISINFVIRAVSGSFITDTPISPWVILCTFFISVFLVSQKRSVEFSLKNIGKYRSSLKEIDKSIFTTLSALSVTCVFVFFAIYSIFFKASILLTLPISLYITLEFMNSLNNCPEKIRNPERFLFQKKIILSLLSWLLILLVTLYCF
jgi:4-hydroxybenzoate polyprenyltransferase